MANKKNTLLATVAVFIFGAVLFYVGTDGFTAYTAETARVNYLVNEQPAFPEVTLTDSRNRSYSNDEFEDNYLFVTFMYTQCGNECPVLEMNMGKVYDKIPDHYIGTEIDFLSISFDPETDNPGQLKQYEELFGADGETWRMATVYDEAELAALLDAFGVVVIPDGQGDFAHNSAFYLVGQDGNLKDIMDFTDVDQAAARVNAWLEGEGEG